MITIKLPHSLCYKMGLEDDSYNGFLYIQLCASSLVFFLLQQHHFISPVLLIIIDNFNNLHKLFLVLSPHVFIFLYLNFHINMIFYFTCVHNINNMFLKIYYRFLTLMCLTAHISSHVTTVSTNISIPEDRCSDLISR